MENTKSIFVLYILVVLLLHCSENLIAKDKSFIYSNSQDSVMMQIESEHKTLKDQVVAIEQYISDFYHLVHLDINNNEIMPFLDKYEQKVLRLNEKRSIAYFYLYKGAFFIDSYQKDSATVCFFKALELFENIKDYTGITHSSIFIEVNNNYHVSLRTKEFGLINDYYKKGYESSLKSNDLFAKAVGNWSMAIHLTNKNIDSMNFYCNLALNNLSQLSSKDLPKKLFGFMILSYIKKNNELDSTLVNRINELFYITFNEVVEKKYFDSNCLKIDKSMLFSSLGNMDSAAYYARIALSDTSTNSKHLKEKNIYNSIAHCLVIYEHEKSKGNYEEALKYHELYHHYWEEYNDIDPRVLSIATDKVLSKKKFQNEQIIQAQRQTFIIIIGAVIIFLVSIILLVLYLRYRDRQRINTELEKLNRTKDKLFSIISHDIRGPVGSIIQMLDIITLRFDNITDEAKHKYINNLRDSSHKLFAMLDNLLSWSRLNLGHIKCVRSEVDINSVVSNELGLFEELMKSKNLRLKLNKLVSGTCFIDQNIFMIIFSNLISNAIKFSPVGDEIEVTLEMESGILKLTVKDNGAGIDPDTISQIKKNSVVQSKTGTSNERGNGLGLSIVSELIEMHNGSLEIISELNKFTKIVAKIQ